MGTTVGRFDWNKFSFKWLLRTKKYTTSKVGDSRLNRVLGLFGVTSLGIAAMLGPSVYVIAPVAIPYFTGPSLFVSFIIAAIAALFSGLCYAELGARIPRAGSAYAYTYVSVGEIGAFFVGWNMILVRLAILIMRYFKFHLNFNFTQEYVIGTATLARCFTIYIDVFAGGLLDATFRQYLPIGVPLMATYFDPVAFTIVVLVTALMLIGVKQSTAVNNVFVLLNLAFSVAIIGLGISSANPALWELTAAEVANATQSKDFGYGGFMPYGFKGVMTVAAASFFIFIGFDAIGTAGEEVVSPQRNIPISIMLSLAITAVIYITMAIVFSMQVPYYEVSFDNLLVGIPSGNIIIAAAAIIGLVNNIFGVMFPSPRIIYAMAEDGLMFNFLATVNSKFQTPAFATLLAGGLSLFFVSLFDVIELINMLSIGTITAYTMVAVAVLVLRYQEVFFDTAETESGDASKSDETELSSKFDRSSVGQSSEQSYLKGLVTCKSYGQRPSDYTSNLARILTSLIAVTILITAVFTIIQSLYVYWPVIWWPMIPITIFSVSAILLTVRLGLLPQNVSFKTFKIPLVPLVPVFSLLINFYLLASLDSATWIRFGLWTILGFANYVFYGMWSSRALDDSKLYMAIDDDGTTGNVDTKLYGSTSSLLTANNDSSTNNYQ